MSEEKVKTIDGQEISKKDAHSFMRKQFQNWLDQHEKGFSGKEVTDDMPVIPPGWPSRGTIKNWILALED